MGSLNVTVVGCGYVGLVSAACFAQFGSRVTCVDNDSQKLQSLKNGISPIYEPGLENLLSVYKSRLHFSPMTAEAVSNADIIFIAVGTPTNEKDGSANLDYLFEACEEIAPRLSGYTLLITKSTVPVGTSQKIKDLIKVKAPLADVCIASNPEFLREGQAINDFVNPERVLIGLDEDADSRAITKLNILYGSLIRKNIPIVYTDCATAELAKYAANAFLATKITFVNEVANLCEKTGADITMLTKAIGLDSRIGNQFLKPGPGYGGSCFPKDTLALSHIADEYNSPLHIVDSVIKANESHCLNMVYKVIQALGGLAHKTIAIWGLSFKANTDDVRKSPALIIIPQLIKAGAKVKAYDPQAMAEFQKAEPKYSQQMQFCKDQEQCLEKADCLVIITEWQQFKTYSLTSPKLPTKIVDLRNLYDLDKVVGCNFDYYSLGRKKVINL
jgi:UDPglucose 6-dehydrogenase